MAKGKVGNMVATLDGFSSCRLAVTKDVDGADQVEEELDFPKPENKWSVFYRAPETTLSGKTERSTASDVWSLGVLVYVVATGRLPFATTDATLS